MVIDSSAVLAIVQSEPEKEIFRSAIGDAERVLMSAVTYVECATVIAARRGPAGSDWFGRFLSEAMVEIVSVDAAMAESARKTYMTYGKGYHKAHLNLGDCFSYALAKSRGEALLYKGKDFSETDIASALA